MISHSHGCQIKINQLRHKVESNNDLFKNKLKIKITIKMVAYEFSVTDLSGEKKPDLLSNISRFNQKSYSGK